MTVVIDDGMRAVSYEQLCADLVNPAVDADSTARSNPTAVDADPTGTRLLSNTRLMDAVVGFVRNEVSARELAELIESQRENYPARTFGRFLSNLDSLTRRRSRYGTEYLVAKR